MKSPKWRRQRTRADLRQFEISRHGPIIIYTRLPAGGTYYPICTFPASSDCLIGISDTFSVLCLRVSAIFPTCSLYPQQKRAYSALHPQAWTYIYTCPCPKALTECSPLDFRRSSVNTDTGSIPWCRLQLNTHTPYVCGFAWSDMVHGCMVYTELAPRRQQFHMAPAMPALKNTTSVYIQLKNAL